MRFGLTLLGYRNFNRPVTISFGDANVALVGPNNVGKSNVFRFLYEFRDVLTQALGTMGQQSQLQASLAGLKDQSEYFPRAAPPAPAQTPSPTRPT